MDSSTDGAPRVFTIGHSNHTFERFLELLRAAEIAAVADVRSLPRSQYASWFDQTEMMTALTAAGLKYVYLGRELGGRPKGEEFYDLEGRVIYERVAGTAVFRDGISRLRAGLEKLNVAVVCAEEDPAACHRRLLVCRVLFEDGVEVLHVRGDGRIQSEQELRELEANSKSAQLELFGPPEESEWKSIPSVSRKRRQNSFSAF